jgi:anti-sigma-K factor RskA
VITHNEASQVLAAFALDAVEGDEHERIQAHVSGCRRCRMDLDHYREVAAGLGTIMEPPPRRLWDRIADRLAADDPRRRRTPRNTSHAGKAHFPSGRLAATATAAVGAAAVATVLGLSLIHADTQLAHLQGAEDEAARTATVAAMETRGHHILNLDDAHHHRLAEFVVLPDGRGYLVTSRLPTLPSRDTYQLWEVVNGQTISVGVLGRMPHLSTFTLDSNPPFGLGVSVEPAGGSVRPSGPMLVSGYA